MTLLVVAYLGGMLTIVSPCILPALPFVFARAEKPFVTSTLPMLAGMAITFAAVATLAAVGGGWAVQANDLGRLVALALLAVFGVALVSSRVAGILTRPAVAFGNRILHTAGEPGSAPTFGGSLLIGVATGLLWAPCAGPILGLVLTGAALQGANVQTTLLLLAYAAGAATSLALALLVGGRLFGAMKRSLGGGEWVRRGLGVAVIAGVAAIGLGLDTGLFATLSSANTDRIERALLDNFGSEDPELGQELGMSMLASNAAVQTAGKPFQSDLPVEGTFPSLDGTVEWLNSAPLSTEALRGKVVLVNFWTYSCINCIRALPYVRAWADKYKDQGLVVIGVHTPEFAFERNVQNIRKALTDFQIDYPIAVDSNFKVWRAFRNSYWPALYFIDAKGRIRHHAFGEGNYQESEKAIQALLAEAGERSASDDDVTPDVVTPDAKGAQAAPDLAHIRSSETYIGYQQASNFASPEGMGGDRARTYTTKPLRLNQWALAGNWTVGAEQATLNQAGGGIIYRFSARDLHLILGPGADGQPVRFQVTIDGKVPGENHGADIDAEGHGTVTQTRLYQLVRQSRDIGERTFEVRFLDPGVAAFAFTFG
ncbi:cytochrome c biogenesis protein DipZ [Azospirillum brasilense]|uniref:cytochrome c biogenesis protein DipZ n=1 Tax=Azospirillum brasilense TaxID=192 RepID=UPI001EDB3C1C|nr:cytochrome c biogenesis protein DipZ [Azospirillum brasilense]UKJ76186.1 cytochrome c biogenesis protein DipZ [Azospirillum brasilense]